VPLGGSSDLDDPTDRNSVNPRNRTIRIVTIVLGVLIVASLVLSMVGCSGDDGGGSVSEFTQDAPDQGEVVRAIADEVIVPAFAELAQATAALATSTEALCASPTEEGLDAAQAAWNDAQGAWRRTEAFRFGPAKDLHSIGRIAYPIDPAKLDEMFATPGGLPASITPESVADLGADVRGLAAIEQLLFTPSSVEELTEPACAYAHAASVEVQAGADELAAAWTEGVDGDAAFADQMAEPGDDSMYGSEQEAVNDLVNGAVSALTTITEMELGPASGAETGTPDPASVDQGAAHRAAQDVADMLASVQSVYGTSTGDPDSDAPELGLSVLVAEQSLSTDQRVIANLADAAAAVAAMPAPLVSVDPADGAQVALITDAYDQVSDVRVAMRTEVASQLGVTVGFSDSDGDG
jgi:predicted lipoprotein